MSIKTLFTVFIHLCKSLPYFWIVRLYIILYYKTILYGLFITLAHYKKKKKNTRDLFPILCIGTQTLTRIHTLHNFRVMHYFL